MHEFEIQQEIGLNAPRERVWRALTEEIGKWWAYRTGPDNAIVSVDPRLGGQFVEQWGDGDGAVWGVVIRVAAPERLRLVGNLGMKGPGRNDCTYELEDRGSATLLKLTHCGYGHRDPTVEHDYRVGWAGLFGRYLKAWVEEGKTHREVDAPPHEPEPATEATPAAQRPAAAAPLGPESMQGIEALELPMEWLL